jgi:hypothetical protein
MRAFPPPSLRWVLACAAALAMALLLAWPVRSFFLRGQTDFVHLYTAAHLAGTGKLYDASANYEWHERLFGVRFPAVLHSRPPFYAFLLQPLAWLPYRAAFWLFVSLNALAAAWVFRRLLWPSRPAAVFGLLYPATYLAILWGQDVWLAAALFGASVLLLRRKQDFAAGLVLPLCAIKAHLFLLVPVAVIAQRRWRVLAGGAACGGLLLLAGFAAAGPGWLPALLEVLSNPVIHRGMASMPNLQGLAAQLGGPPWFLPLCALAVGAAFLWICLRAGNLDAALAAALTGSFLLSYHAYPHDAVMLLLAFALLKPAELPRWPKAAWYVLASPVPLLCALAGAPFHVVLPVLASVALAALALARWVPRSPEAHGKEACAREGIPAAVPLPPASPGG